MGFARRLASPKKKTREKAISLLVLWLTSQKQIEEDELKKIWKGLFYCVWHSDKVPVQADLIERLASIFEKLDIALSLQFFKVFLMTMRREWVGIDRLRLDKFYLLLRKCLVHMFMTLESSGWNADSIKEFMDTLLEKAFLANDQFAALGINLHYADIYLQELKNFLPMGADTFKLFLEPFLVVCANASSKPLLQRIKENIFDYLFNLGRSVISAKQEGVPLESGTESLGSLLLSLPLGMEAFKLASMPSTSQANRKLLYELHRECETLEKLLNISGVTLSLAPSVEKKKKKKKKKAAALGLVHSIDKPQKREMQQETRMNASKKNATGPPARDVVAINTGKRSRNHSSAVLKEGTLPAECEAGEGNPNSNKRKVSECERGHDVEIKEQEECSDKSTRAKQRSTVKQKKVASVDESPIHTEESKLAQKSDSNGLGMDDSVVSKLEGQFDMLADRGVTKCDTCLSPIISTPKAISPKNTGSKKRKRVLINDSIPEGNGVLVQPGGNINDATPMTSTKLGSSSGKVKRVRFALKKNLVWTPTTPLPAEIVRVPPSATPRGSALKQGVPPGPIVSTTADVLKQRKATPTRPSTHNKTNKNRKSVLKRVKLLGKQRRSI